MSKRHHLSRRQRILWIATVLFCLLFQQLAMASYICPLPAAPANTALTGDCAAMAAASKAPSASKQIHSSLDARCAEHCSNNTTSTPDARVPMVPPLLLPPVPPTLLGTIAHAPEHVTLPDLALRPPDLPPTLRFCTLLI
ncbi:hypothetical protein [Dyella silvatica]|uniref:hypothetical protein n=1 Tax=Dyella silvatica TaxID=2992128 RepID=UPI0022511081|nr:hypothetical protein [Dyella silvatica]